MLWFVDFAIIKLIMVRERERERDFAFFLFFQVKMYLKGRRPPLIATNRERERNHTRSGAQFSYFQQKRSEFKCNSSSKRRLNWNKSHNRGRQIGFTFVVYKTQISTTSTRVLFVDLVLSCQVKIIIIWLLLLLWD